MADAGEEVKPYKIKVSSKYLDLTKQKLELTRLPHEGSAPKSADWWEPKPQVEPIIDYWLEKYSWREQEDAFNQSFPQFRVAISLPSSETPLRLHFIHVRSSHANAVPLLLIPPFPFTNLAFGHLVKPFTDPEDAENNQPFHLVIPALPGTGFSDPLPNNTAIIFTVADMLNTLMQRLYYTHYLATNAGAGHSSPAQIDWKLANQLAVRYSSTCLGTHLISPPLTSPRVSKAPWEWTKWVVANFFHAGILGYIDDDFSALKRTATTVAEARKPKLPKINPTQLGLNKLGLLEPNTLAYALCDSPTGLLVFVLKGLSTLGPDANFSHDQIVTLTNLAWLPGPEYAMRFWAHCTAHQEDIKDKEKDKKKTQTKPRVAITVFLGGKGGQPAANVAGEPVQGGAQTQIPPLPNAGADMYVPPAWGKAHYDVLFAQRVTGKSGLLAWERPEVITAGVRGLAQEVKRLDSRLKPPPPVAAPEAPIAPLEQVVVREEPLLKPTLAGKLPTLPEVAEASVSEPFRAEARTVTQQEPRRDKGKGKALDLEPPPGIKDTPFSDGESPDTLVNTPPLDK